jgi:MerR family transcriptional regulator, heat shock protein HspR
MIYNRFEVEKMGTLGTNPEEYKGVYIMRVASMLTGMHPQTLRKYERAGLLEPSRSKKLRMYSEADIARLKMIKNLVDEVGLNIAGVKIILHIKDAIRDLKEQMVSGTSNSTKIEGFLNGLDSLLIFNAMKKS